MQWLVATALLIGHQDKGAVELTNRFLALLDDQPEAASAMLDPQGMVAVHHIGGPLKLENLGFPALGCVMREAPLLATNAALDDGAVVATDWLCPVPEQDGVGRPLKIRFWVKNQQIASVFLEFAETTEPWPPQ